MAVWAAVLAAAVQCVELRAVVVGPVERGVAHALVAVVLWWHVRQQPGQPTEHGGDRRRVGPVVTFGVQQPVQCGQHGAVAHGRVGVAGADAVDQQVAALDTALDDVAGPVVQLGGGGVGGQQLGVGGLVCRGDAAGRQPPVASDAALGRLADVAGAAAHAGFGQQQVQVVVASGGGTAQQRHGDVAAGPCVGQRLVVPAALHVECCGDLRQTEPRWADLEQLQQAGRGRVEGGDVRQVVADTHKLGVQHADVEGAVVADQQHPLAVPAGDQVDDAVGDLVEGLLAGDGRVGDSVDLLALGVDGDLGVDVRRPHPGLQAVAVGHAGDRDDAGTLLGLLAGLCVDGDQLQVVPQRRQRCCSPVSCCGGHVSFLAAARRCSSCSSRSEL